MKQRSLIAAVAIFVIATACSSGGGGGSSPSGAGGSVSGTLTIWHNYGTEQNATVLQNLAKAFEQQNPNVTVNVVSQPGVNYFALLQAAAVSKSGPDLAVMWTGVYTLKYKSFLQNLKGLIPAADLNRIDPNALRWTADGFNVANGPYVVPFERQFYMGFYNKQAFAKAGVSSVPTTWNELYAACQKLQAAGYMPMTYGNGGQPLGAYFYPWYDISYMMTGLYSVDQWAGLYDGSIKWTDPAIQEQLDHWAKLKSIGCTNSDVLTKRNNLGDFESGKAAMIIDGTWDTKKYTDALGNNVAAFVPPFTDAPVKGVIDYSGAGLAMMNYSQNKDVAAAFLDFTTTDQAAKIIDAGGLIPVIEGASKTSNPVNQEMLDFVSKMGMTPYPMVDNLLQPEVVDAGNKVLPPVLDGSKSPADALGTLEDTWNQLPPESKLSNYG